MVTISEVGLGHSLPQLRNVQQANEVTPNPPFAPYKIAFNRDGGGEADVACSNGFAMEAVREP